MQNKKKIIPALAVMAVVAAGLGFWKVNHFAQQPLTIDQPVIYTLPSGTGRVILQQQLQQQHIIPSTFGWFGWLLKVYPELANFKAGTYRLMPGMTVRELLQLLASGKEAQFPSKLVEGQRVEDWLGILRKAPYLHHKLKDDRPETLARALGISPQAVEGAFYADTYFYTARHSDISLLNVAHQRMQTLMTHVWESRDSNLPYTDPGQMLTMASIIEKETAVASERKDVASVFINRLQKGMRLQTDPTVIFGLGRNYTGTLTRRELETPNAYNTYFIRGLPPGPIAIPGKASLQAAAHPAKTRYLYFVANGQGGHTFTTTLADHHQAVKTWRKAETERKADEK